MAGGVEEKGREGDSVRETDAVALPAGLYVRRYQPSMKVDQVLPSWEFSSLKVYFPSSSVR
jgi:hypothetical protein